MKTYLKYDILSKPSHVVQLKRKLDNWEHIQSVHTPSPGADGRKIKKTTRKICNPKNKKRLRNQMWSICLWITVQGPFQGGKPSTESLVKAARQHLRY